MRKSLAVCSWSLRPDSTESLINQTQECGIQRVQLGLEPFVSGDWDLDAFMESARDHRIELCSGMMQTIGEDYSTLETIRATGGIRPDQHWDQNLARAREHAKIASELGLSLVTFHAGFLPEQSSDEYTRIADRIQRIAECFGEYEIVIGMETGQERAAELMELLDHPHMSHIGVNFDPANMILYGVDDPRTAFELLKDKVVQVHIKDALRSTSAGQWGTEVSAGSGEVDWERFFETADSMNRDLNTVIEREAGDDRVADIITARELCAEYGCVL
ncbi:MAG: sugar phosphate isomerase/epimerase family protein [Phycisphaerales bacterium]